MSNGDPPTRTRLVLRATDPVGVGLFFLAVLLSGALDSGRPFGLLLPAGLLIASSGALRLFGSAATKEFIEEWEKRRWMSRLVQVDPRFAGVLQLVIGLGWAAGGIFALVGAGQFE